MGRAADWLHIVVQGRPDGTRARMRRWFRPDVAPRETPRPGAPPPTSRVPAGFSSVLAAGDVAEGALVEVMVDDAPVVLCRVQGTVHAVSGICPHAGGPIGDGSLDGHVVTCPLHGWSFDVRDGRCAVDDTVRLPVRAVAEVDGRICVGGASTATA